MAIRIEFYDAEAFRVVDVVAEHGRLTVLRRVRRRFQALAQTRAVENVVAEHHCARLVPDELPAKRKRLRQTIRRRLHLVGEVHAVTAAVAEKPLEIRQVSRCRDNQNIANSGQHQRGKRIINHRFVVNRQQLLARHHGQRVKPRSAAAG